MVLVFAGVFAPAGEKSPALEQPSWLKVVDLGGSDPRLKGYKAPEGVKVEIVTEAPAVINPVGMAFDEDGRPHVLEWARGVEGDEKEGRLEFKYRDGTV